MIRLEIPCNTWREVWQFWQVFVAVVLSRLHAYWPAERKRREAAAGTTADFDFFDEMSDSFSEGALRSVDTHEDGTLTLKTLSAGVDERTEIAVDAMTARWRDELQEAVGPCDLRVQILFGEADDA